MSKKIKIGDFVLDIGDDDFGDLSLVIAHLTQHKINNWLRRKNVADFVTEVEKRIYPQSDCRVVRVENTQPPGSGYYVIDGDLHVIRKKSPHAHKYAHVSILLYAFLTIGTPEDAVTVVNWITNSTELKPRITV